MTACIVHAHQSPPLRARALAGRRRRERPKGTRSGAVAATMADMTEAIIEESFTTAETMLAALDPTSSRWTPDPRDWAFRGQGDSRWKLVPSILRGQRWLDYLNAGERADATPGAPLEALLRASAEWGAIREFMVAADRAGLAIPDDMQDLRDGRQHAALVTSADIDKPEWPPTRMLSIVAMAQHYGVPTRLLDWSWRPMVSAYFAAQRSAAVQREAKGAPGGDGFTVWALRTRFVVFAWRRAHGDEKLRVQIVTAPQASNPNLAAQAGLFTVDRDTHAETCFSDSVRARFVENERTTATALGPAMYKLTLAHSEAGKLLRLLAFHGVSAATVYPGHAGVAQSLEEQRLLWDHVPHPGQNAPRS